MTGNRKFIPILIAIWLVFTGVMAAAWLFPAQRQHSPSVSPPVSDIRPISVLDGPNQSIPQEEAYAETDALEPEFNDYPPPVHADEPPPARTHRFPLPTFLLWETVFFVLAAGYIAASLPHKLSFLSKHHPTLGNFTNLKYTPLRLIGVGDGIALLIAHNLMLVFFYAYYLHNP